MRHRPENVKAASSVGSALGDVNVDSEEEKKQSEGRGFTGLSSMVSDVDAIVEGTPKKTEKKQSEGRGFAGLSSMVSDVDAIVDGTPQKTQKAASNSTPQQSGISPEGKWLVGIAGIAVVIGIIFIVLGNQSDSNRSSQTEYSPGTSSTVQPQAPSRPAENKPLIGRNNVLSTTEIRYCLAEEIRMNAAETVVNIYSESDVNQFNRYVSDFNSRCAEFRYRQGTLESARRDIEPYRGQLQEEGRNRQIGK